MDSTSQTAIVCGGNPLFGVVTPIPNKNFIVAALPASILTDKDVTYKNVPRSTDVLMILEMITLLGGVCTWLGDSSVTVNCSKVNSYTVDKVLGNKIRASLLFVGPLLARFGKAKIPVPGGCGLGRRSISAHIDVFSKLGIKIDVQNDFATFTRPKKIIKNIKIWQNEASPTATENFELYCAGTSGEFQLTDAACEPHAGDLLDLLLAMGAKISGRGSNKITVGGGNLKGATFTSSPDFVDIGGFIVAAAVTKGKITIKGGNIPYVAGMIDWFTKFGIKITAINKDLIVDGVCELKIDLVNSGFPMAGESLPKFIPRPWPGFPVDVLPPIVTLACKTSGNLLVNNWMYETGMEYCHALNTMGAKIRILDSQKVIVSGPCKFTGGEVTTPDVIQACKTIFLASLADTATTTIHGFNILKRRYPDIVSTYKNLGAEIKIL